MSGMELTELFAKMWSVDNDVHLSLDPAIAAFAEVSEIIQALLTTALELQRQIISFSLLQIAFTPIEGPADVDQAPQDEGIHPPPSVTELINTLIPVTLHSLAQYYGDSITQGSTLIKARQQDILHPLYHQSNVVDRNIQTALIPAFTSLGSASFSPWIPPHLLVSQSSESSTSQVREYGAGEVGRKGPLPQVIGPTPFNVLSLIPPEIQQLEEITTSQVREYGAGEVGRKGPLPQVIGPTPFNVLSLIPPEIQQLGETVLGPLIVGEKGLITTVNLITSYETATRTLTRMQETLQDTLIEGYAPRIPFPARGDVHERQVPLITAASSLLTLQQVFNPLYTLSADVQGSPKESVGGITREVQAPSFSPFDILPQGLIEPAAKGEPARGKKVETILRPRFEIAAFTPRITDHLASTRSQGVSPPPESERRGAGLLEVAHYTQGLPVVVQAFSSSTTAARTVINNLSRSFFPLIEATGGVLSPGMLFQGADLLPRSPPFFEQRQAPSSEIPSTPPSSTPPSIFPHFSLLNLATTISPSQQFGPYRGGISGKPLFPVTESPRFNLPTTVTTINEAFSVLENIHLLTTQSGNVPVMIPPAPLPPPIGTHPPNSTLVPAHGMAATSPPKNEVTIHNTFNIEIAMKGNGDERELRELGQKIGTILSDELKRYGGLSWR